MIRPLLQLISIAVISTVALAAEVVPPTYLVSKPAPGYPPESRRANEEGRVLIRVVVDTSGVVTSLDIAESSGFVRLDSAAVTAVRNWKFTPGQIDGKPVQAAIIVPIVFKMERDGGTRVGPIPRIQQAIQIIKSNHVYALRDDDLIDGCYRRVSGRIPEIPINAVELIARSKPSEHQVALEKIIPLFDYLYARDSSIVANKYLTAECIRGALEAVDERTQFVDEEELYISTNNLNTSGSIGVEFAIVPGRGMIIVRIFPDSPAAKSDLQAGDLIQRIDGALTTTTSLTQLQRRMQGAPGSTIELVVVRNSESWPLTIQRQTIGPIKSPESERVLWKWIEPQLLYIRIPTLGALTSSAVANAIKAASLEENGKITGIVVDLRNNRGGPLLIAAGLSAIFMSDQSLLATSRGRTDQSNSDILASKRSAKLSEALDFMEGLPKSSKTASLVILTNARTSGAAELIAAAGRTHRRAQILGEKTAGKGTVESVFVLRDGSRLQLPTALLTRADGQPLNGNGINPDIVMAESDGKSNDDLLLWRARDLIKAKSK